MECIEGGYNPPSVITEDEYVKVRDHKELFPDYYVGYVGFHSTFGAKYFGGYARGFKSDGVTPRIKSNEAYRNTMKQVPNIKDVNFVNWDFKDVILKNAVIYCDPPYQNTTKYSTSEFNHSEFWEWCRDMSENNHVFISEYTAPDDFKCIWSKSINTTLKISNQSERIEKLFVYSR